MTTCLFSTFSTDISDPVYWYFTARDIQPCTFLEWVHTKLTITKQKQNRTNSETVHTHTSDKTQTFYLDVSVFCPVHIQWTAAEKWIYHVVLQGKWMRTYAWLQLALYSSHQKCQKEKTSGIFGSGQYLVNKILTYKSLPYSTFELLKFMSTAQSERSILRWEQLAGSETCNKTEIFWSLPTSDGTWWSCRNVS